MSASSQGNIPSEKVISDHCGESWESISFVTDIYVLVGGTFGNVALLWIFLKDMKLLSASKVLGLNLAVMDLIYLCLMPVKLFCLYRDDEQVYRNSSDFSATAWKHQNSSTEDPLEQATVILHMFNLVGCPLLLVCMCVERYLAVTRPVLYLKLKSREHRIAVSAVVWLTTFTFCVAAGTVKDTYTIMLTVFTNLSCLFIVMLACLGGMIWSLQQQSPTLQTRAQSSKRRAVGNVLVVVVCAVLAYFPVLVMVPMIISIVSLDLELTDIMCNIFGLAVLSPRFGVFIGPVFYLSKARQMCILRWTGSTFCG